MSDELTPWKHVSVLPTEVLHWLNPQPGQTIVDCTLGAAGHARAILERLGDSGRLIGIDQDPSLLERNRPLLADPRVKLVHANFEDLAEALQTVNSPKVDGVLADLGFCSDQVANPMRGFSFQLDGPLDMRLDPSRGESAAALVRRLHEKELADIFWQYGEERHSRRIAWKIVEARQKNPIVTTAQLADLVRSCVPKAPGPRLTIDPATRVFQALRIAVNDELGALERLLAQLSKVLRPNGRAVLISFHSLEDRLVKHAFRQTPGLRELTRKPITASEAEKANNPRSRSAKLRAAEAVARE